MSDQLRPNIFPAARYRDAGAALEFLKSAFGAREKDVFRDDAGAIRQSFGTYDPYAPEAG